MSHQALSRQPNAVAGLIFTMFRWLPLELQDMIWNEALNVKRHLPVTDVRAIRPRIPAVARACSRALMWALKAGSVYGFADCWAPSCRACQAWFDPKSDIVFLSTCYRVRSRFETMNSRFEPLWPHMEQILIDGFTVASTTAMSSFLSTLPAPVKSRTFRKWVLEKFMDWPKLRTVYVWPSEASDVSTTREYTLPDAPYEPAFIKSIFGFDSVALIDLRERAHVDAIVKILKSHSATHTLGAKIRRAFAGFRKRRRSWDHFISKARLQWLHIARERDPSRGTLDPESPWAKETLAAMPNMYPVYPLVRP
ncbi:hypothetical protein F4778DRAFT_554826 [Xylariomycetidae sp. FL2044]|nr:hypothetical protein F4778DRAFT_554826 [Xylariomycetidae sp. FL2044]